MIAGVGTWGVVGFVTLLGAVIVIWLVIALIAGAKPTSSPDSRPNAARSPTVAYVRQLLARPAANVSHTST